jgi:hypothetical protein
MSKGAQDWIARTDVLLQTLSELIVRAKYGAAQVAVINTVALASVDSTCVSIAGKGCIYAGNFLCTDVATCLNDFYFLSVDGQDLIDWSFNDYYLLGIDTIPGAGMAGTCVDDVNFRYCQISGFGMTFETSLKVKFREAYARTPQLRGHFMYALI